jgi:hypothetical protein
MFSSKLHAGGALFQVVPHQLKLPLGPTGISAVSEQARGPEKAGVPAGRLDDSFNMSSIRSDCTNLMNTSVRHKGTTRVI